MPRHNVEGRQELRAGTFAGLNEEVEKSLDRLKQGFGLLIALDDNQQRTLGHLPQQNGINGLRGGGQPGEAALGVTGALAQMLDQILKCRMAIQMKEKLAD